MGFIPWSFQVFSTEGVTTSSFHHEPFRHDLVVDLGTVHENTHAVNSSSNPGREHKASYQRDH
jgi:hypothetical protein